MIDQDFFARSALVLARELIGATLLVDGVGGLIVETEAYDRHDPAAHSFAGQTARNAVMFGERGRAYVYRSYGLHWCLNVVCGREPGSAVLLRALEPVAGAAKMEARRGGVGSRLLCSGPGRLCQALGVTGALNGSRLDGPPFLVVARAERAEIVVGTRIGVSRAAERPWRFGLAGSRFLSKPFAGAGRVAPSV
jgi:DNA-3-methyladenine glycosylase